MFRDARIFRCSQRALCLAALAVALIAAGVVTGRGRAAVPPEHPVIPAYAAKIVGKNDGRGESWGVWLYGTKASETCWATKTAAHGLSNAEVYCGASSPPKAWQLAAQGSFGSPRHLQSVLFFLTRPDVVNIVIRMSNESHDPAERLRMESHRMSADRADHAKLPRRVTYAVAVFPGPLPCIEGISAFDRNGEHVGQTRHQNC